MASISLNEGTGRLFIRGSNGYDGITIETVATSVKPSRGSVAPAIKGLPNYSQSLDQVVATVRDYRGNIVEQESFHAASIDKIVVDAQGGNDFVRNDTRISADINGSSGRDVLIGGDGNDVIHGHFGNDIVYGRGGDDVLLGGSGQNRMYGGDGNDQLFGGTNNDELYGDSGNDSLFGGFGTDQVYGGPGSDRFLSWEHSTDLFFRNDYDPDHLGDLVPEDAKIIFRNGEFTTNQFGVYLEGYWDAEKIQRIDAALKIIHEDTGNTDLLKRADGKPITFHYHDAPDVGASGIRGFNNGDIHLTKYQFDGSDNYLIGYTLHEIGHNWAKPTTSHWLRFLDLRKSSDNFVSSYAESGGAGEDWSETFAAYFMQQADIPYYNGEGAPAAPDKIALMADWVETMSS